MHAKPIVTRLLSVVQPLMHAARWRALTDVVLSAVNGNALSLSALALGTGRATALRHRVKCVDRLLGNVHLHQERVSLYGALARHWLTGLPQLLIVVDWSSLSADMRWHWLRASVVVQGRSLTLYEEVHPRRHLANLAVHRRFLDRLEQMLPATREPPILLTDAGFRNPWFRLVAKRGWRWIGRIRNRDYVQAAQSKDWFPAKRLYQRATAKAQDWGFITPCVTTGWLAVWRGSRTCPSSASAATPAEKKRAIVRSARSRPVTVSRGCSALRRN